MATEAGLWKSLSVVRNTLGGDLHIRRVENAVGMGDPDVEGCYRGNCFHIELKVAPRPARGLTGLRFGHDITNEQAEWHTARAEAGGRSFFLIQVGDGAERALYLVPGSLVGFLRSRPTEAEIARFRVASPMAVISQAAGFIT